MTIQECYQKMGADYEDVLKRLYSESMIRKFARMFLDDDSYPKLEDALKKENVEEAFREWFDRVTEQYNITIGAIRAVQ